MKLNINWKNKEDKTLLLINSPKLLQDCKEGVKYLKLEGFKLFNTIKIPNHIEQLFLVSINYNGHKIIYNEKLKVLSINNCITYNLHEIKKHDCLIYLKLINSPTIKADILTNLPPHIESLFLEKMFNNYIKEVCVTIKINIVNLYLYDIQYEIVNDILSKLPKTIKKVVHSGSVFNETKLTNLPKHITVWNNYCLINDPYKVANVINSGRLDNVQEQLRITYKRAVESVVEKTEFNYGNYSNHNNYEDYEDYEDERSYVKSMSQGNQDSYYREKDYINSLEPYWGD